MHLNGKFTSEKELKKKLDYIYLNSQKGHSFYGIIEVAFNEITIITAIHNIKANKGSQTAGIDQLKMDKYLQMDKDSLIKFIQNSVKKYRPKPVKRVYIEKANGKMRPLGIPTIFDRIIQECLRIVLEPMMEARFYPSSYGFRPYRATKHAIKDIFNLINCNKNNTPIYAIEGDIKAYFDNINHRLLLKKLWKMGIRDKRVLSIIKEMFKIGYIDNELHSITKNGTAQGAIISPLLANCYLNSFDWTVGRMYQTPVQKCKCIRNDRKRLAQNGVKPKYLVRYADDWIILTTEENEAKRILCYLRNYYRYRLKLELSEEKTFITNLTVKPVKFLGFIVKAAAPRGAPTSNKPKLVGKAYPNMEKVKTQVQNINNEVRKLKNIMSDTLRTLKINKINSIIMGVAEHLKTAICSDTFSYIDENVHRCAYATFKKMYGKKIKNHYVPLKKLINNQNRHNGYETKTFAVKAKGSYIGITKAFVTHSNWERCPFNSKMTPYTEEGRELYIKRNGKTKKLPLNRPNIMEAIESTSTADRQVYNFEYSMNRAYAYNRDKGKCRVCSNPLKEHERHCHHVRNSLPINEINKVPNLAWLCVKCHEYIHGMDVPIKTTKEIKIKIMAYKEKLKVVRV